MSIRERVTGPSPEIDKLAEALAKAQGAFKNAELNKVNPHFRNKYADLASLWAAIREPLSANGLSVFQSVRLTERGVACDTVLMHSSGQWLDSTLELPLGKADPQGVGSALTYARRYSLAAAVGISAGDEDDDGAKASEPERQSRRMEGPINLDASVIRKFDVAKTLEELAEVWRSIPANIRGLYSPVKDEAKARLEGKAS